MPQMFLCFGLSLQSHGVNIKLHPCSQTHALLEQCCFEKIASAPRHLHASIDKTCVCSDFTFSLEVTIS